MVGPAEAAVGMGSCCVAVGGGAAVGDAVAVGVGEAGSSVSVGEGLGLGVAVPVGDGEGVVAVGEGVAVGARPGDAVAGGSAVTLSVRERQPVVLPVSASARQTRMRRGSRRTDARISIAL